ncbi:MAG: serine/threonine protein kinase [Bradymonadaceae bacterium]|nr:serine/threonine protein kinase [Lujinxingiaceae bacterium]
MATNQGVADVGRDVAAKQPLETLKGVYSVEQVLGEGALGRTYLASDNSRGGAKVAIKELLPSRMKRWKDYELFHRECSMLRSLNHPGIPSYFEDFIVESDDPSVPARLFLVQRFVDGRSLQDRLDDGEVFSEERVRDVAVQALEILCYLHGLNPKVIHRDIKPSNLMLTPGGKVILIDFGAVREAVTADGLGSTIVGTFGYMPPEQYAGQSVAATDLFALGATCVQLLTGREPGELFEGLHTFRIPDDLPVTLGFERILLGMTEPEVSRRFQSAQEVLDELAFGFLMVPKDAITGKLPIPNEIRPAPRPMPGFQLRDAYHGRSHLSVLLVGGVGATLTLVFPITAIWLGSGALSILGFFLVAATLWSAGMVSLRARIEIDAYRRGIYTLGEVTGRFLSASSGVEFTHMTYRYRAGSGFLYGSVSTRDRAYRTLSPGDPVGVIYLSEEPDEHVMYAVPAEWAKRQTVGLRQLSGAS